MILALASQRFKIGSKWLGNSQAVGWKWWMNLDCCRRCTWTESWRTGLRTLARLGRGIKILWSKIFWSQRLWSSRRGLCRLRIRRIRWRVRPRIGAWFWMRLPWLRMFLRCSRRPVPFLNIWTCFWWRNRRGWARIGLTQKYSSSRLFWKRSPSSEWDLLFVERLALWFLHCPFHRVERRLHLTIHRQRMSWDFTPLDQPPPLPSTVTHIRPSSQLPSPWPSYTHISRQNYATAASISWTAPKWSRSLSLRAPPASVHHSYLKIFL